MTVDRDAVIADGLRVLRELTQHLRDTERLAVQRRTLVVQLRGLGVPIHDLADAMGTTDAAVSHLLRKAKRVDNRVDAGQHG